LTQKTRDAVKAIVDIGGNGHYTSISAAIDAGEKYIFIKNGSYSESSDMTLEGVTIIGESMNGVILELTECNNKYD